MRDRLPGLFSTAWTALGAFVLGACVTAAAQSVASGPDATAPAADPATATATGAPTTSELPQPGVASTAATFVTLEQANSGTNPPGSATIQHLARGENAYVGRLRLAANAAVPTHRDPTEEYIHVLSGHGTMTLDGALYEVVPGMTIYMPANAEVSFQNGDEEMVGLQVFAGPEPAGKYAGWTGP